MDAREYAWNKLQEIAKQRNLLLAPREVEISEALAGDGINISPSTIRSYMSDWIGEGRIVRTAQGAIGIPHQEE